MSFISPEYVLFFCLFFVVYFALPAFARLLWLLAASYFFYAYGHGKYLWIILLTTAVDYTSARLIERAPTRRTKRIFLATSLLLNLGVLFLFKYFNFFNTSFSSLSGSLGIFYPVSAFTLALPVGISFYTFQSMAYTIDVYREKIPAERNIARFATFVAYFPQLVAGPIERGAHMLPQFRRHAEADPARFVDGFQQILWGFFKKVVIADRLAIYVNAVYNAPQAYTGWHLILATFFFAFQIYCDFSAYSDIAIGTARVMGFNLSDNFRQPYLSRSVREFWGRWHISLSTWFRDYVYIPLGGNRVGLARGLFNLFIIFLISGLWHGASWTFVLWGALHGLYVCVEALLSHYKVRLLPETGLASIVRALFTFTLVSFAFIFFRANSFEDAGYIVSHLFNFSAVNPIAEPFAQGLLNPNGELIVSFGLIALLLAFDYMDARWGLRHILSTRPTLMRWGVYYAAIAIVIASGWYGTGAQEFIYFQF